MTESTPAACTTAICRSVYRAQARAGQASAVAAHFKAKAEDITTGITSGDAMTLSLFQWGDHFIAYWESVAFELTPDALFGDMHALLEDWPGGLSPHAAAPRSFVPMMDIFHSQSPQSIEHWRRKQPFERLWGGLARLQPEMVSSYIFYHFQLQEEKPGSFDKYGIISLHEDLIFYYLEKPAIVEDQRPVGKLSTTNTPDNWHDVMFPHFHQWDDAPTGEEIWREIELIAHR